MDINGDVIRVLKKGTAKSKKKTKTKYLETVIHCCKCNGQSCQLCIHCETLCSIQCIPVNDTFWCIMSSNVINEIIDPAISEERIKK